MGGMIHSNEFSRIKLVTMKRGDFSPIEYRIDERVKSRVGVSQPRESLEHHVRNALLQKGDDGNEL